MSDEGYRYDTEIKGWRQQRYERIMHQYNFDHFRKKTLLEVGAARGHIGDWFATTLGAIVTCTDHYQGHVDVIKERYPYITAFVQNINDPWPTDIHYDVIVHMGVLYHQPKELVEVRLKEACSMCNEMILETETSLEYMDDPYYIEHIPRPPDEALWEPIATEYCNPSRAFIDRILTESNMTFKSLRYIDETNRYMWFCTKQ